MKIKSQQNFPIFQPFRIVFEGWIPSFVVFRVFFYVFVFWGVLFCFGLFFFWGGWLGVGDGSSMHLCIFKIMYQFVGLLVMSFRGSLLILSNSHSLMILFLSSRFILELMIHHTVPFLNF